jgi:hypothetical protein
MMMDDGSAAGRPPNDPQAGEALRKWLKISKTKRRRRPCIEAEGRAANDYDVFQQRFVRRHVGGAVGGQKWEEVTFH